MDIYVDSANLDEIKKAKEYGLADGVTTNPTLLAKESDKPIALLEKIAALVDGPVHAEVLTLESGAMVKEARELVKIADNIVIKIPMTGEGLKAVYILQEEDIQTNLTLMFSPGQAILAAKAGASYVCPFLGRLDDICHDGLDLLAQIKTIFDNNPDFDTEIIAASIRTPNHVVELAQMGVDILTLPSKVIDMLQKHPLTDRGIKQFEKDAKKFK